eukprot:6463252-Amphidinium_carterae.1
MDRSTLCSSAMDLRSLCISLTREGLFSSLTAAFCPCQAIDSTMPKTSKCSLKGRDLSPPLTLQPKIFMNRSAASQALVRVTSGSIIGKSSKKLVVTSFKTTHNKCQSARAARLNPYTEDEHPKGRLQ